MKRDTHRRSFVGCGGGGGGGGGDGEVSGAKLNGDTAVLISIGKSTDGVACFSDGRSVLDWLKLLNTLLKTDVLVHTGCEEKISNLNGEWSVLSV